MRTVEQILSDFGQNSVRIIRDNMNRAGQNASGETSSDLESDVTENGTKLTVSGPGHVWVLETGRGPWQGGSSANLPDKLEKWIQIKGVNLSLGRTLEQTSRSLAFLINKNGTKLYQEGGRDDIITPIFAPKRFEDLFNDIANAALDKTVNVIDQVIDG